MFGLRLPDRSELTVNPDESTGELMTRLCAGFRDDLPEDVPYDTHSSSDPNADRPR